MSLTATTLPYHRDTPLQLSVLISEADLPVAGQQEHGTQRGDQQQTAARA